MSASKADRLSAQQRAIKKLREHRIANKLCVYCGDPAAFLSAACDPCTAKKNRQARLRDYKARVARPLWQRRPSNFHNQAL